MPTEDLIRTSESMAAANAIRQQEQAARLSRLSAQSGGHQFGGAAGLLGVPSRKHKTVMLSKNLGTMRKAKEEKRKEAQADPNDDMILRILRMRPEAERYLKDRSRQKVGTKVFLSLLRYLTCDAGTTSCCTGGRDDRPPESECRRRTHDRNGPTTLSADMIQQASDTFSLLLPLMKDICIITYPLLL